MDEHGNLMDGETSGSDDISKALASGKRAALRGESSEKIIARITKQWPHLKGEAGRLAKEAQACAERHGPGQEVLVRGVHKRITNLEQLNRDFALLEAEGHSACVIRIKDSLPISAADFVIRVAGQVVVSGINSKGEIQYTGAAEYWRGNSRKRRYTEIVFSGQPPQPWQYNLFPGFGVQPREGHCLRIIQHIEEVICGGDQQAARAFINLLAWQVQNIGKLSRIIVALFSEKQQTGKGALLEHVLLPIFGRSGFMTSTQEHGLGRFNDRLRGCSFLFLDEAAYARDRKLADRIKSLCQAQTLAIEGKGVPVIDVPSGLNLFVATNHREIAHVEKADARYWILSVSEHRAHDFTYFASLFDEIDHGGREAFLHLLLNRDIRNFNPQRDVPRHNAALTQAKLHSVNAVDVTNWLMECLDEEVILGAPPEFPMHGDTNPVPWAVGAKLPANALREAYRRWAQGKVCPFKTESSTADFWEALTACGFLQTRTAATRKRLIPDLDAAKASLRAYIAGEKNRQMTP